MGRLRAGAVLAIALAAGLLVWLLLIRAGDDEGAGSGVRAGGEPVAATSAELTTLGEELGHRVYWADDQGQDVLELTRTSDDRVYVRYLEQDAEVGDARDDFLTVGTYPVANAFKVLKDTLSERGSIAADTSDGGLAVTTAAAPTSVYIAYPDQDLQIEVYHPDSERALDLVTSGEVQPAE